MVQSNDHAAGTGNRQKLIVFGGHKNGFKFKNKNDPCSGLLLTEGVCLLLSARAAAFFKYH